METSIYLKTALEKLFVYQTPKKVVDFIYKEKWKSIIGNPKFKR
jgi:hypothetical protein